ncbi:hypothetical protein EYC98_21195 [Halieaceae bacterium IMCC14734]|uniref:DUF1566 domain-containing protein n=1 Tax=Candidatus Litorirhabdus singularis TaxID=2518993 RepID=A0ABT3TPQ9_9GAMM|nr:hypothetical protein [Candidatus Litorirhabdus singularis]MCX2983384.1 hypothetical protein [Candidatus Litorirhabdus singularis]
MTKFKRSLVSLAVLLISTHASAALYDRGNGLIYDDVLNVTWLHDADFGAGSSSDDGTSISDRRFTHASALAWAQQLVYLGHNNWRLPNVFYSIDGEVLGGEMNHLMYETLGWVASNSYPDIYIDATTGQERSIAATSFAWYAQAKPNPYYTYTFQSNYQEVGFQPTIGTNASAWAVADGDIGAVPIPAAAWLFGSALMGLGALKRKKA